MSEPMSADDFADAQAREYNTYRATQVIFHNNVRAYNPGDAVPISNVEKYGYDKDELVERVDTAAPASEPAVPATDPTNEG